MPEQPPDRVSLDQLMESIAADDAERARLLLDRDPDLRARINEPIGPFDSRPLAAPRSRAMIDVLLAAGADINAKSQWWAGGFGYLHTADPELADYAIERGAVVDVHSAARLGRLDRLREIIESDPESVHARGGDGQTSLALRPHRRDRRVSCSTMAPTSTPRDIDHESTPAQWMLGDRLEVARYLVQQGCTTDILLAAAAGEVDCVRKHLDADPGCIRVRASGGILSHAQPQGRR